MHMHTTTGTTTDVGIIGPNKPGECWEAKGLIGGRVCVVGGLAALTLLIQHRWEKSG